MKTISNKSRLVKFTHYEKNLGFVPTMGAIHQGHISLIKKCVSQCEKTIVSIMENLQTNDGHITVPQVLQKYFGDKII